MLIDYISFFFFRLCVCNMYISNGRVAYSPLVGPGSVRGSALRAGLSRDLSPFLHEFRRKPRKIPKDRRTSSKGNMAPLVYQLWAQNLSATSDARIEEKYRKKNKKPWEIFHYLDIFMASKKYHAYHQRTENASNTCNLV